MSPNKTPTAEIIAIGTELLLGDTINSNAAWISNELADLGIAVYHHSTVGDNPARICEVVRTALTRPNNPANILIFTGGLGPTADDLTVATLAKGLSAKLVSDPASEEAIKAFFIARGMTHSPSNLKQALRPEFAEAIPNPVGTAPGIAWEITGHCPHPAFICCYPGVPRELKAMWPEGTAMLMAWLDDYKMTRPKMARTFLHFFGIGESKIGELLADVMDGSNPTVAPYVGRAEVRLRIAAQADTQSKAEALIEPVKNTIIERLAPYYIGEGIELPVEQRVADLLKSAGSTIAVAESCTGGLVSNRLTDIAGSSAYTTLNMVTYSNEQKISQLNVPATLIDGDGAVSETVAKAMADGIREKTGSDIGLALTGIAGPDGGTADKPVGLVWMALATQHGTWAKQVQVNPKHKRPEVKFWFSQYALHWVREYLTSPEDFFAKQAIPVHSLA